MKLWFVTLKYYGQIYKLAVMAPDKISVHAMVLASYEHPAAVQITQVSIVEEDIVACD